MDDFLKTLDLERETMDQTADLLKSEGVVLSQILSGSVSIEDLEEVGVPKEALEKIDKGAKVTMPTHDAARPKSWREASASVEYELIQKRRSIVSCLM